MKRRLVNFRCFLVTGCAVIITCLACLLSIYNVIGLIIVIAIPLGFIAIGIYFWFAADSHIVPITCFLCFFFSVATLCGFYVSYYGWNTEVDKEQTYSVQATVENISVSGSGSRLTLADVSLDGEDVSGRMTVSCDLSDVEYSYVRSGYTVVMENVTVYKVALVDNGKVNGSAFRSNVRYRAYTSDISFSPGQIGFWARVRADVYDLLALAMGAEYGSIAYGMLTGDKGMMDSEITNYFSVAGLGHILAVSGLHIGFIVMLLGFIFRKLHVRPVIYVPILSLILVMYAWFAGFSPSVVRAVFMSIVGLLTMINGRQKDALNSLMLACTVIVAVRPFYLFEVGFLMSFGAVLCIILFSKTFERWLARIHIPRFVAQPLSLSASVQIGIMPAMTYFFNTLQTYSMLVNMVLMPLLTVVYCAVTVALFVAMIIPAARILLSLTGIGIGIIDSAAHFVSLLPYSVVTMYAVPIVFVCFPLFFAASRFFMLPRYKKTVSACIAAVCAIVMTVPTLIEAQVDKSNMIIPIRSVSDVTSIVTDDGGDGIVIGDFKNAYSVKRAANYFRISKINSIFVYEIDDDTARELNEFCTVYQVNAIYCPKENYTSLSNSGVAMSLLVPFEEYDGNDVAAVYSDDEIVGYLYSGGSDGCAPVLSLRYSVRYDRLDTDIINLAPVLRTFMYLNRYPDRIYLTDMPINYLGETPRYQLSTAANDRLALDLCDSSIYESFA